MYLSTRETLGPHCNLIIRIKYTSSRARAHLHMAHNQNQNHLDDEDGDGQKEISFGFERIFFWLDRARLAINEFSFGWIEQRLQYYCLD